MDDKAIKLLEEKLLHDLNQQNITYCLKENIITKEELNNNNKQISINIIGVGKLTYDDIMKIF